MINVTHRVKRDSASIVAMLHGILMMVAFRFATTRTRYCNLDPRFTSVSVDNNKYTSWKKRPEKLHNGSKIIREIVTLCIRNINNLHSTGSRGLRQFPGPFSGTFAMSRPRLDLISEHTTLFQRLTSASLPVLDGSRCWYATHCAINPKAGFDAKNQSPSRCSGAVVQYSTAHVANKEHIGYAPARGDASAPHLAVCTDYRTCTQYNPWLKAYCPTCRSLIAFNLQRTPHSRKLVGSLSSAMFAGDFGRGPGDSIS
jgi:hypothetical protein